MWSRVNGKRGKAFSSNWFRTGEKLSRGNIFYQKRFSFDNPCKNYNEKRLHWRQIFSFAFPYFRVRFTIDKTIDRTSCIRHNGSRGACACTDRPRAKFFISQDFAIRYCWPPACVQREPWRFIFPAFYRNCAVLIEAQSLNRFNNSLYSRSRAWNSVNISTIVTRTS